MFLLIAVARVPAVTRALKGLGLEICSALAASIAAIKFVPMMRQYLAKIQGLEPTMVWDSGLPGTDTTFLLSLVQIRLDMLVTMVHLFVPARWCTLLPCQIVATAVYVSCVLTLGDLKGQKAINASASRFWFCSHRSASAT